jgi:predicted MFS family arabinose efflux permease
MEMLVPIGFFAMIAAIVIVPIWLKSRERSEMQSTLRAAIEKGQPVPQEMIDAMTKNVKVAPSALSDIRTGVIWIAIGAGIGVFGFLLSYEEAEAFHPLMGVAAIPAIIGLTYVVLSFFNPNKSKRT